MNQAPQKPSANSNSESTMGRQTEATIGLDLRGLDPTFKAHAGRGTGRYVRELSSRLLKSSDDSLKYRELDSKSLGLTTIQRKLLSKLPRGRVTFESQFCFRKNISKTNCDLVHFFSHGDAPAFPITPQICTILDLIPLRFPHLYKTNDMGFRFKLARFLENRAAQSSVGILAISEATKYDIIELLGIPADNIFVTHLGVDESFFKPKDNYPSPPIRQKLSLPENGHLALYVGGIDPRKNVPFLFSVLKEALSKSDLDIQLALAGNIASDKHFPALLKELENNGVKDRVHMLGFVEDETLRSLMLEADIFLFPSLYEGFGLPVLEAMASGLKVLAGDNSCMKEVMQETGERIVDNDVRLWADALIRNCLLKDQQESSLYIKEIDAAKALARTFNWENTAKKTKEAYQYFLNQQFRSKAMGRIKDDR